jgi:hypothetical protein
VAFVALSLKIKIAPVPETGGPMFVHAELPLRAEKIAAVNRGCAVGAVTKQLCARPLRIGRE